MCGDRWNEPGSEQPPWSPSALSHDVGPVDASHEQRRRENPQEETGQGPVHPRRPARVVGMHRCPRLQHFLLGEKSAGGWLFAGKWVKLSCERREGFGPL